MDAPDVFRHVEGFGLYQHQRPRPPHAQHHHPKPVPQLPREPSSGDGEGEASHRIAHTLTACCRCRQVSIQLSNTTPPTSSRLSAPRCVLSSRICLSVRLQKHLAETLPTYRGKPAAIQLFPAVCRANGRARYASTLTPPRARKSAVTMSSNSRKRCVPWRQSSVCTRTRRNFPKTTKTC